jgi:hypothetical protein
MALNKTKYGRRRKKIAQEKIKELRSQNKCVLM